MKAKWISIGVNVCRFIVALTFIFSGFVKAIDPLGTQYKINDYLQALGCEGIVPPIVTLGISVLLSAVEFYTGMMLLFAINRRVMSRVAVGFMVIMTIVTFWLWVANPITDCGCFGDAVHLTNGQTLLKNVVLLQPHSLLESAYKLQDLLYKNRSLHLWSLFLLCLSYFYFLCASY